MNLESKLKDIQIALKLADWFSTEEHVDYNVDLSLGFLFVDGKIVFFDNTILEFTESITPERFKYRYQYMKADGSLIFRYDNVPHHPEIPTFPDHKHYQNKIVESSPVDLKQDESRVTILQLRRCKAIAKEPTGGRLCSEEGGKDSQTEKLPIAPMSYLFTNGRPHLPSQVPHIIQVICGNLLWFLQTSKYRTNHTADPFPLEFVRELIDMRVSPHNNIAIKLPFL